MKGERWFSPLCGAVGGHSDFPPRSYINSVKEGQEETIVPFQSFKQHAALGDGLTHNYNTPGYIYTHTHTLTVG